MAYLYLALTSPTNKNFFENLDRATALVENISEGERLWILGQEAGVNGFPMQQRENYRKLVEAYPNDERTHNLLGIHYFGQLEWALAIPEFQRATEINPDFSQPYNQLGYAHRFLENYEEAEGAFKKYIELIPDEPNPLDSSAELLMKMGRFDESIENYRKALTIDEDFIASFIGIGSNYVFMGQGEQARLQAIVPPGWWQTAEALPGPFGYALMACVVAPGFDFADFEIAGP